MLCISANKPCVHSLAGRPMRRHCTFTCTDGPVVLSKHQVNMANCNYAEYDRINCKSLAMLGMSKLFLNRQFYVVLGPLSPALQLLHCQIFCVGLLNEQMQNTYGCCLVPSGKCGPLRVTAKGMVVF